MDMLELDPEFSLSYFFQNLMELHGKFFEGQRQIFEIYKRIKPDLSIIDGFIGMQGNGPVDGSPIKMNLALASLDPIAVDVCAAKLMGIDPNMIGYLSHILKYEKYDESKIQVIGNTSIANEKKEFRLHSNSRRQLNWK